MSDSHKKMPRNLNKCDDFVKKHLIPLFPKLFHKKCDANRSKKFSGADLNNIFEVNLFNYSHQFTLYQTCIICSCNYKDCFYYNIYFCAFAIAADILRLMLRQASLCLPSLQVENEGSNSRRNGNIFLGCCKNSHSKYFYYV